MEYLYKKQTLQTYIESLYTDGLKCSFSLSPKQVEETISKIGIFRFKGYVKAFRDKLEYYSIDDILELYYFDKGLSLHFFDLISSIEIQLKTYLVEAVYHLTDNPFCYLIRDNYTKEFNLSYVAIKDWEIKETKKRVQAELYKHYRDYYLDKYDLRSNISKYLLGKTLIDLKSDKKNINYPPFHYFIESATLGTVIYILSTLRIEGNEILKIVSKKFGFYQPDVFMSYLLRFKELRNRCAHHGRLFNRNYRSVKAIGKHKVLRKEIYDHRLLDVYYTLHFLMNDEKQFQTKTDLEKKLINGSHYKISKHLETFVLNCMRKR